MLRVPRIAIQVALHQIIKVMNTLLHTIFLTVVSLVASSALMAESEAIRISGDESSKPPVFTVDGPWLLDWSTRSEFPMLANFEMRLYDGTSGEFIGTVAQLEGTGRGLKLFEDGGSYQLAIVAGNVDWDIEISEVSQDQAGQLERAAKGKPSLEDTSQMVLRRVRETSFVEWRSIDDETLLLFSDDGLGWRATFASACPGLKAATAISFVAPVTSDDSQYDSVLLDDGTRCYFDRVSLLAVD
jgi:hypothetical protein